MNKLPNAPLLITAYPGRNSKTKNINEKAVKKKELDRARCKTIINIGAAFPRWREIRDQKGFKTDAEFAIFLLDSLTSVDIIIDQDDFSHIENSVIDPSEDRTCSLSEEDTPSEEGEIKEEDDYYDYKEDEDSIAPVYFRTGCLDDYQLIIKEETVHDAEADPTEQPLQTETTQVQGNILYHQLANHGNSAAENQHQDQEHSEKICLSSVLPSSETEVTPPLSHNAMSEQIHLNKIKTEENYHEDHRPETQDQDSLALTGETSGLSPESTSEHSSFHCKPVEKLSEELCRPKKKHVCPICGRVFTRSSCLTRHLVIHSGKRPFKCFVCGRGFTQRGNVKTHMKIHKGEEPKCTLLQADSQPKECSAAFHVCRECGMDFPEKHQLEEHRESHRMSYTYPECGTRFKHENDLKVMGVHSGDSTYHCSVCGQSFTTAEMLKAHKVTHTGDKIYHCGQCGKTFSQSFHLNEHLKTHGGEDQEHFEKICLSSVLPSSEIEITPPLSHNATSEQLHLNKIKTEENPHEPDTQDQDHSMAPTGETSGKSPESTSEHSRFHYRPVRKLSKELCRPKKKHACPICGRVFTRSTCLTRHLVIHSGKRPFKCFVCGKGFTQRGHLKTHMKVHTGEEPKCTLLQADSQPKDFPAAFHVCRECGMDFPEKHQLAEHRESHRKPYVCSECGTRFKHENDLKVHMRVHSGDSTYHCSVCGQSFTTAEMLKAHEVTHTGDKIYHCGQCGKTFSQSSHLNEHLKTHIGEDQEHFEKICLSSVLPSSEIEITPPLSHNATSEQLHLNKIKTEENPHEPDTQDQDHSMAPTGDTSGTSPESTSEHSSFHHKPLEKLSEEFCRTKKNHVCPICGRVFTRSSCLTRHLVIHSGKRPFTCFICGKGFTQRGNLKTHMKIHTGDLSKWTLVQEESEPTESNYHCNQCGKTFSQSFHLSEHLKSHTEDQPYLCSICGKGYSKAFALKIHLRVHTGENPYTCKICGKCFYYSHRYQMHLKSHDRKPKLSPVPLGRPKKQLLDVM